MKPDLLLAVSGMFVLVAVTVGWAAAAFIGGGSPGQRRLRALAHGPGITSASLDERAFEQELDPMLLRLRRLAPRKSGKAWSRLQRRLMQAGFAQPHAADYYSLVEVLVPAAAAIVALVVLGVGRWPMVLFAAAVGYALPTIYLDRRIAHRQTAIRNGLPDALDLLTLCVEAGTGLDTAIAKASEELDLSHPELARELRLMTTEIRAGRPRREAFQNLAERTGVEDVRTLVSMLTQTDRFGTSISQALRTHAATARTKRRQRAEEQAGKVSVKLVFPLALCLFPALYVVVFGSALLKLARGFGLFGM